MTAAAQATNDLARAQFTLAGASRLAARGAGIMTVGFLAALGIVGGLGAAFAASTEQFGKDEVIWIRLAQVIRNSGIALTTQQFRQYAEARQYATGIDAEATATLANQLINLRFTREQVLQLIPALQEMQASGHGIGLGFGGSADPTVVAKAIARFVERGDVRALIPLGFDINAIKRSADKVGEIIRQLNSKYAGNIDLIRNSLPGAMNALRVEWEDLKSTIGDFLAPWQIAWAELLRGWIFNIKQGIISLELFASQLGIFPQSVRDQLRAAAQAAQKGWSEHDTGTLEAIEKNTSQMASTLARNTLGAAGEIVRETATIRNFNLGLRATAP